MYSISSEVITAMYELVLALNLFDNGAYDVCVKSLGQPLKGSRNPVKPVISGTPWDSFVFHYTQPHCFGLFLI